MTMVLEAGPNLSAEKWKELRLRAIFDHCKWDPQSGDDSVLARFPLLLSYEGFHELRELAENLSREALAAERELLSKPELWRELAIPPKIRHALARTKPESEAGHARVMRFDFHFTTDGWQISEVNADVPSGYVEGSGWNALFAEQSDEGNAPPSPAGKLAQAVAERLPTASAVALVHATTYSDDRQVMMNLGKELSHLGLRPALAGPENVFWQEGRAFLKSGDAKLSLDAAIRFFPAEWFPLLRGKNDWTQWFAGSETPLCNPGSAILIQSKRFPLVWTELATQLGTWRRLLPETYCPSRIAWRDSDEWVIKPVFGRVGEEVGMKNVSNEAEFRRLQREASRHPQAWIVQRRFETASVRIEDGAVYPCVGVFTVNGKFAGIYGRASRTPLVNQDAQDVAVLIRPDSQRSVS